MIDKPQIYQILHFISKRWLDMSNDLSNNALSTLPNDFWMNSVGGKAGNGRWITMIMYTENENEATSFKEVLMRWQANRMNNQDLIQIKKSKDKNSGDL
ncbi:MAG: hypothetical protein OXF28_00890 [Thaumarchaeota archaeon]|nr:hypothetical protein [Nitrososphaerota archaeon]MCY3975678.1 hypothetical protein [Nitrososphaerota archaeon]